MISVILQLLQSRLGSLIELWLSQSNFIMLASLATGSQLSGMLTKTKQGFTQDAGVNTAGLEA